MQGDFGAYDFSTMTDDELYDLIVQHLGEYSDLDLGWIDVTVRDGNVTLSGRVASDGEVQVAEKAVLDVLGVPGDRFSNELMVDELHRAELPEASDEAVVAELEVADELGDPSIDQQSDTAGHLVEDLVAQTYGTRDASGAVQEGASYEPPDRPIPDGYGSREDH
ncbi:MAG TPA: BON domain-containing protein [Longimicrobiaceae bacterium]|nr:BON domain-containing protein [Longimicrobiaceae bacterium]